MLDDEQFVFFTCTPPVAYWLPGTGGLPIDEDADSVSLIPESPELPPFIA
jgi:hypothetical protein